MKFQAYDTNCNEQPPFLNVKFMQNKLWYESYYAIIQMNYRKKSK
jgi:hypothetical protein